LEMLLLITGGSGSGKSEYAEKAAVSLGSDNQKLYYIATMHNDQSAECRERIERHRAQREGKGFETWEWDHHLAGYFAQSMIWWASGEATLLIEDLPNLLANELYLPDGLLKDETDPEQRKKLAEKVIVMPLLKMSAVGNRMILVTDEVGMSGEDYDPETREYLELLAYINEKFAEKADAVTEVVASIPSAVKGEIIG